MYAKVIALEKSSTNDKKTIMNIFFKRFILYLQPIKITFNTIKKSIIYHKVVDIPTLICSLVTEFYIKSKPFCFKTFTFLEFQNKIKLSIWFSAIFFTSTKGNPLDL